MKLTNLVMLPLVAATMVFAAVAARSEDRSAVSPQDGVALAIVYDTSGSMQDSVHDVSGANSPKYVIANRALNGIVDRLQAFSAEQAKVSGRQVQVGLVVFEHNGPQFVVKLGPFDAIALRQWLKGFNNPSGSTPLGEAVRVAGDAILKSNLTRKHVLVITDGMNTSGPEPDITISKLQAQAQKNGTGLSFHFVAFDVDSSVFKAVKKLGVTVVGAADAKQLNTQLEFILERKILLEEEEPPQKPKTEEAKPK